MTRPLIISDCDEVLLHMVAPFKTWLETSRGVSFRLEGHNFAEALRWQESGELLAPPDVWRMLRSFFDTQMDSQAPIAGAVEGINTLAEKADVVILTNLVDHHRDARAEQLAKVGINARVFTNQGPKGPALKAIIEEYAPTKALFIDDLAQHHASVAEILPDVTRLHLCGEPMIAHAIDCAHKAGHAHSRIDRWDEALPWLLAQLED
ncbi:HAD family hydrolase [Erythrobacter sp. NE805]|uniref:HAD family hydrolase n=1 Tax=Erythrobacter sp. NE805 TaxID=3389875 RepID=UPI00396B1088